MVTINADEQNPSESVNATQRRTDGRSHDLDFLVRRWAEVVEFAKAIEDFEEFDPKYWEFESGGGSDAHP